MKKLIFTLLFLTLITHSLFSCEVYFSPHGGCQEKIIEKINQAESQIEIAMFSFTSKPIAEALVKAHQRDVKIKILLDRQQASNRYSQDEFLIKNGMEVILDNQTGLMHNKICIIDDKTLLNGSFNWTGSAEKENQENMMIFTEPEIIGVFQKRFDYLWQKNNKGGK